VQVKQLRGGNAAEGGPQTSVPAEQVVDFIIDAMVDEIEGDDERRAPFVDISTRSPSRKRPAIFNQAGNCLDMAYDLEEQEQLESLKAWWKQYGNAVTWALIVILLGLAAWSGWNYWQRVQARDAVAAVRAGDQGRGKRATPSA
jgi:hypothetical protein